MSQDQILETVDKAPWPVSEARTAPLTLTIGGGRTLAIQLRSAAKALATCTLNPDHPALAVKIDQLNISADLLEQEVYTQARAHLSKQ